MKKFIALLLVSVFTVTLCSCNTKYHSNNDETALTVGKLDISYDLFRYFYLSYKNAEGSKDKTEDDILDLTLTNFKELAAIYEMAEEYDIEVSSDVLKLLKEEMKMMEDSYKSKEEMIKDLDSKYLSQKVYYDLYYYIELEIALRDYLFEESSMIIMSSDKEVENAIRSDFLAAVTIVILPETEKDGLKGEALANKLLERINGGEDIEELAKDYSDGSGTDPLYFAPMTTQKDFEDKIKSLKFGEVSDVYKTDVGYCISKRLEITDDYINENFDSLREEYKYSEYLKIMTQISKKCAVTYAPDFDMAKISK